MKDKKKIEVGGLALFNGVLFNSTKRQVIAQQVGNKIKCRVNEYIERKSIIDKVPILRGIVRLVSQLESSVLEFVTSVADKKTKNSKIKTLYIYIILIVLLISIPIIISAFVPVKIRDTIQIVVLLVECMLYLVAVKNIDEINTLLMYHGAEHKVVNAYENLKEDELSFENVKKQKRFHKRCGGNFTVYLIFLIILDILFLPIQNLILKDITLILLTIINLGIAFEILNIFSKLPKPFDIVNVPATLVQYFTTKEPTDNMLKLAMYGMIAATREKEGVEISKYVQRYIANNLKNTEYDVQDIYSILEYITKKDRNKLFLDKDNILITINQEIEADTLLNRFYIEKYPLQYLTHKQYFFNEVYYVDENVLIPRQDSEILVEKALEYISKENIIRIIDLCTGSGALGISIARNSTTQCNVELIDISTDALNVAYKNIYDNRVQAKVTMLHSNLLEEKILKIEKQLDEKVEMIVSNPPYIKTEVIDSLQDEVKKEPMLALDGGKTGLDFYIRIFKEAKKVLKNNGLLLLEIGYDQLDDIKKIIKENEEYILLESVKDYGGNDRVVICRFQDK